MGASAFSEGDRREYGTGSKRALYRSQGRIDGWFLGRIEARPVSRTDGRDRMVSRTGSAHRQFGGTDRSWDAIGSTDGAARPVGDFGRDRRMVSRTERRIENIYCIVLLHRVIVLYYCV